MKILTAIRTYGWAVAFAAAPLGASDIAFAQSQPPTALECAGGLLCDLHAPGFRDVRQPAAEAPSSVVAPSDDCGFLCRTFGIGAPPPRPIPVAAAEPAPAPAPEQHVRHRHKMHRKAAAPVSAPTQ